MQKLERPPVNPILAPREGYDWEINGTFNPGVADGADGVHVLYRAVDAHRISRLGYARIGDGMKLSFRGSVPVFEPSAAWEEFGCEDPRVTRIDDTFYITYTAYSRRGPRLALASTNDFSSFKKYGLVGPDRNDKDFVIFPERINGRLTILHRLRASVQIAYFDNFLDLRNSRQFWKQYLEHFEDYEVLRPKFSWEARKIGVGPPPIKTDRGWLVIYHGVSSENTYSAGAALLDLDEPTKVLARTEGPILEPEAGFERRGIVPDVVFPEGATVRNGNLWVYYGGADRVTCVASAKLDVLLEELDRRG